ncbi:MAG: hypothetical protein J6D06_02235 [Clostridia bacterium]|nr:hypothetical protein [Clostridia bacterium]
MDNLAAVLLIFSAIAATSYAWGMRGTTIGGEKGAMLPGALIGLLLAVFSDVLIVREHFYIFSALGAVSMYFGGSMTYGETLGLSMNSKPAENMKKGLLGVFVKGFLWFGSFGAIFSTGINAVCYQYTVLEIAIVFSLAIIAGVVFYILLNKPLKKGSKQPKIYFSKTRQESWGSLLGVYLVLLVFGLLRLNTLTIVFSVCCALFGGFGWLLGQLIQIYSIHYAKENIFFSKILSRSNNVDSWKIMECVFGAFGGIGAAISFIITYPVFKSTVFTLEINGGLMPFNRTLSQVLFIIWLVLICADMVHYFIKKPILKSDLKNLLDKGEISQAQYSAKLIKAVDEIPKRYKAYDKITVLSEPVLYGVFSFIMISLGGRNAAIATSVFILFLVISQEIALEKKINKVFNLTMIFLLAIVSVLILVLQLAFGYIFNDFMTLILYTAAYEILTLIWLFPQEIKKNSNEDDIELNFFKNIFKKIKLFFRSKALIKVHVYFIFCIMITILLFVINKNIYY